MKTKEEGYTDFFILCTTCGNTCEYDKDSLKGSTWKANGVKIVLCCQCEDDLLKAIAKGRGLKIKYGDGGEIAEVEITDKTIRVKT